MTAFLIKVTIYDDKTVISGIEKRSGSLTPQSEHLNVLEFLTFRRSCYILAERIYGDSRPKANYLGIS